jgi:hypothetical protein
MKLYRSAQHPGHWVAYGPGLGWVVFPARENGWDERRPVRGLDPVHLREVPATLAARTGMALESPDYHFPHAA